MPISKERKAQSRERIVAEASALFRRDGIDAVSVPALMRQAGLTHGGFYGHFSGKDDLAAAAILKSLQETAALLAAAGEAVSDPLAEVVRSYVSRAHRDHPEAGCAVAALGPEAARGSTPARRAMVEGVRAIATNLESVVGEQRESPAPLGGGRGPEHSSDAEVALRRESETDGEPAPPLPGKGEGNSGVEDDALALFAGMIGAVVLARACGDDRDLSDRVLKVCRDRLTREFTSTQAADSQE